MKIKPDYMLKKVMGNYMIISLSESDTSPCMQTMNETGAFLWDLLSEGADIDLLTEKMVCEYEIDREEAKKDIEAFVKTLDENGFLEK